MRSRPDQWAGGTGGPAGNLYFSDSVLQEAHGEGVAVELADELGSSDPLIEQLVPAPDGSGRRPESSAPYLR